MQEQNLPTPVSGDNPTSSSPETTMTPTGEVVEAPMAPTPERTASSGDRVNQGAPAQKPIPANLPQPIVQQSVKPSDSSDNNASAASSSNPTVADDVDVIEKVWVQKAKSIVTQTKDDPYQQEEEVSRLQADYQMKRFGDTVAKE